MLSFLYSPTPTSIHDYWKISIAAVWMYIPTNSKSFPFSPHSLQHLLLIDYFDDGHSDQRWYLIVILNCISLIMSTLMAESEEQKSFLMKVKEWKSWLKAQHSKNEDHSIWSHHFMANRWGNIYFLGLQNHCRWWLQPEVKRCLLLGRKAMTNLNSILKAETLLCQQKSI